MLLWINVEQYQIKKRKCLCIMIIIYRLFMNRFFNLSFRNICHYDSVYVLFTTSTFLLCAVSKKPVKCNSKIPRTVMRMFPVFFCKESKGEHKILFYYHNILDLNTVPIPSLDSTFLAAFPRFF